ncbi:DNA polymerase I [bacterium]|nr:DNA polymerase I [bacterium]
MLQKKRIFLLDGTAFAYRAYFSMIRTPLTNSKGQNVSAVYGTVNSILKLMRDENPEYIAIAFDTAKPTFRHKLYAEYKSTRAKMPEELGDQLPILKEVMSAMGVPVIEKEGLEADDLVAILAREAEEQNLEAILVTNDKDFFQLINENIKILEPGRGQKPSKWWDLNNAKEKFGVPPHQIIDFMALMGDSSDNIPGVPGIGPKTALKLIQQFSSLDNIYQNLELIDNPKLREKLEKNSDSAYLSRELVTIKTDLKLKMDLEAIKKNEPDRERLFELFKNLEFQSLMKQFEFGGFEETDKSCYKAIRTIEDLQSLVKLLSTKPRICLDTETTSLEPLRAELVGISLSHRAREAFYIPLGHQSLEMFPDEKHYQNVDLQAALKVLKPLLENENIKKIGQNIKYDMLVLSRYGISVKGLDFDPMIASYLLEPSSNQHGMDYLAMKYLNYKTTTYKELTKAGKGKRSFPEIPIEEAANYSGEDADITLRLADILAPQLKNFELDGLFREIELPLIYVLKDMELTGVKLDIPFLAEMAEDLRFRMKKLESQLYQEAGEQFNINSSVQLRDILFNKFRLPVIKKVKTGPSTDVEVLQKLKDEHPIPRLILEYREYAKLQNTYVEALPKLLHPETGKIHTSFNQTIASTGRLSSSNPNLQNIPIRGEYGREIRRAFIPSSEGNVLLSADYSQVELRIMAHISGDDNLRRAFREGKDIHSYTASLILHKPLKEIDSSDRRIAKTVNFGIIYGISGFGLSERLRMDIKVANTFIEKYFERYPGVKTYMDNTIKQAHEDGYVTTIFRRRRYLPELMGNNRQQISMGERVAINAPIQGSAADLIKIAMINIHRKLRKFNMKTRMIIQVHDELLFDIPENELPAVQDLIRTEMEHAAELDVPLKVDIGVGKNWLEAHS